MSLNRPHFSSPLCFLGSLISLPGSKTAKGPNLKSIEWKNLEALGVGEPRNLAELSPTERQKKTAASSGRSQESGRSRQGSISEEKLGAPGKGHSKQTQPSAAVGKVIFLTTPRGAIWECRHGLQVGRNPITSGHNFSSSNTFCAPVPSGI